MGWGVSLSSVSFLLNLPTLQSVQQPSSCQGPLWPQEIPGLHKKSMGLGGRKVGSASSSL